MKAGVLLWFCYSTLGTHIDYRVCFVRQNWLSSAVTKGQGSSLDRSRFAFLANVLRLSDLRGSPRGRSYPPGWAFEARRSYPHGVRDSNQNCGFTTSNSHFDESNELRIRLNQIPTVHNLAGYFTSPSSLKHFSIHTPGSFKSFLCVFFLAKGKGSHWVYSSIDGS